MTLTADTYKYNAKHGDITMGYAQVKIYPVFRQGAITSLSEKFFTDNDIKAAIASFSDKGWSNIKKSWTDFVDTSSPDSKVEALGFRRRKRKSREREGYIQHSPFEIHLDTKIKKNKITLCSTASITFCSKPNRTKFWVKYFLCSDGISKLDTNHFYDMSEHYAQHFIDIIAKEYRKHIRNGRNLKIVHNIKIKTNSIDSEPLLLLIDNIDSRESFSITAEMKNNNRKVVYPLNQHFWTMCGHSIKSGKDYFKCQNDVKNLEWMLCNSSADSALYSKFEDVKGNTTCFVGSIYGKDYKPAHNISRSLVESISPRL